MQILQFVFLNNMIYIQQKQGSNQTTQCTCHKAEKMKRNAVFLKAERLKNNDLHSN